MQKILELQYWKYGCLRGIHFTRKGNSLRIETRHYSLVIYWSETNATI